MNWTQTQRALARGLVADFKDTVADFQNVEYAAKLEPIRACPFALRRLEMGPSNDSERMLEDLRESWDKVIVKAPRLIVDSETHEVLAVEFIFTIGDPHGVAHFDFDFQNACITAHVAKDSTRNTQAWIFEGDAGHQWLKDRADEAAASLNLSTQFKETP